VAEVSQQIITPIQTIEVLGVPVWVKREDQNHPVVQGNKLRKLKYNLSAAARTPGVTVLTFGGAYSNHLLATAFAAHDMGLKVIGVVRGDELANNRAIWSETLYHCQQLGMQLCFVSRAEYRQKARSATVQQLISQHPQIQVIPEGGSNTLAVRGMAELISEIGQQGHRPTHLLCPVGTGGTLAGLIQGVAEHGWDCQVIGVAVLKGLHSVSQDIQHWLDDQAAVVSWSVNHDFHCGGYARKTPELSRFAVAFSQQHNIPLDKVYNSKAFFALAQMIKNNQLTDKDQPMIIHTGGLQGGTFSDAGG